MGWASTKLISGPAKMITAAVTNGGHGKTLTIQFHLLPAHRHPCTLLDEEDGFCSADHGFSGKLC